MMIETEATYRSTTLRGAPDRATLAEAEADEARGVEVEAFLALLPTLTSEQRYAARDARRNATRDVAWRAVRFTAREAAWDAAREGARNAAWYEARYAARDEALDAAWEGARDAAWHAARDAALALITRDLISTKHFDTLTAPMRAAGVDFDALVTSTEKTGV